MAEFYNVITARQSLELRPDGGFMDVMEVVFETPHGLTGTERFQMRDFNEENVARVLAERAATMEAVFNL